MPPTQIQLRRDTETNWAAENPVLAQGEIGIEFDDATEEVVIGIKIGNGVDDWDTLVYFAPSSGLPNPFALPADITPAALTADVNDYSPTGLSTADILRIDLSGGDWSITGLAGGSDGRIVIIQNIDAGSNITLVDESISSSAVNRFDMNADIVIRPAKTAVLIYDATVSRWRLLASSNADTLQGVPISAGLSGSIANNDLLVYNLGDNAMEPLSPHELSPYLFNDSEGDPAPLGTAADGTSDHPARRDHVHAGTPTDGWIPDPDAWTRTGDHTYTKAGDHTATHRPGAKIRYKDGGGFEFGVIRSSSHAAGTTTINLFPNSDFAMAATTITDKYLSYIEKPEGFPKQFNFTSNVTYAGGTTNPTSVTVNTAVWRVVNGDFFLTIKATLVRGSGNRADTIFSIPATALDVSMIPAADSITAAGFSLAPTYAFTSEIHHTRTMANDGLYYINGSFLFS